MRNIFLHALALLALAVGLPLGMVAGVAHAGAATVPGCHTNAGGAGITTAAPGQYVTVHAGGGPAWGVHGGGRVYLCAGGAWRAVPGPAHPDRTACREFARWFTATEGGGRPAPRLVAATARRAVFAGPVTRGALLGWAARPDVPGVALVAAGVCVSVLTDAG